MGSETFADFLQSQKPDPLWNAINQTHEWLLSTGLRMSSRSAAYNMGPDVKLCITSYWKPGLEDNVKFVYHIIARRDQKGRISVQAEGPFEDAADEYWNDMAKRDLKVGNHIVTDQYVHYTIHPDSKNPGWGDGFGGSLFKFQIESPTVAQRFKELGLNIEQVPAEEGHQVFWILRSRNVWSQDVIPKKHRHMFPPNAVIL